MSRNDSIKDFVQNILGCICPDKVFEHIEDRRVASLSSPHTRCITIGGRLLIYIWNIRDERIHLHVVASADLEGI